jgi:hypothetical protein
MHHLTDAIEMKMEIPLWGVITAIVIALFHVGMTYAQFDAIRSQTAILVIDSKAQLTALHLSNLKQTEVEGRVKATEDQTKTLDRRITAVEDLILRRGVPSSGMTLK